MWEARPAVMSHLQVIVPQGVESELQAPRAIFAALEGGANQDDEGGSQLALRARQVLSVDVQAGESERGEQRDGDEHDLGVGLHYHRMQRGIMCSLCGTRPEQRS